MNTVACISLGIQSHILLIQMATQVSFKRYKSEDDMFDCFKKIVIILISYSFHRKHLTEA